MRKRYALVGLGSRGYGMFARPLVRDFADVAEVVAFCDLNRHRMDLANERLGTRVPSFDDFQRMLAATSPDCVVVCTVDGTHHRFIIGALEAGCEVITEKPMTTTAAKVRDILEAERRTGGKVRVSFNARYGAHSETLYKLLRDGVIGEIVSASFAEYLNTSHGADYFRRWHRQKENSGGLLIHKATHHFDQLNWWIGAEPESVFAMGDRRFYGPTRRGVGERCLTCQQSGSCEFYMDLRASPKLNSLYLEGEEEDGYYRDRCVFGAEIDIEDTVVAAIRYANGVLVSYTLGAFSPYEGQRIGFGGTKGRIDIDLVESYHGPDEQGVVRVRRLDAPREIRVSPLFGEPYAVPIKRREGGHGGSDERIREHLFREGVRDPLDQVASSRAGAMSALVGAAANKSMASGQLVRIAELLGEG
jgi:predicted dehydrogenase